MEYREERTLNRRGVENIGPEKGVAGAESGGAGDIWAEAGEEEGELDELERRLR